MAGYALAGATALISFLLELMAIREKKHDVGDYGQTET
jgi:hypothetical protein